MGICCMAQDIQTRALHLPQGVAWGGNGRELQKGGDIHIPMTDSWKSKWQPTVVFVPGEFHGLRSLVGYSPWVRKESNITE